MRKTYLEKKFRCEIGKIQSTLLKLGYTQFGNNFYKKTSRGRLHVKLDFVKKNSCKMTIHHDVGATPHYTIAFDLVPHRAWKNIEKELFLTYGTSFEL